MTQLSPHFSLAELTVTGTGLANVPSGPVIANLTKAAAGMELIRTLLGHPIKVNSGYRSLLVNAAVGGAKNSAHMSGNAVDFVCPAFGTPYQIAKAIEASDIRYDQIIQEGSWLHVSFANTMRMQKLTARGKGFVNGIVK